MWMYEYVIFRWRVGVWGIDIISWVGERLGFKGKGNVIVYMFVCYCYRIKFWCEGI